MLKKLFKGTGIFFHYLNIEFWIAFIVNITLMFLTYAFKGVDGVTSMMESLNSRFDGVSLTATGAAFLIGGILWVFYYFFNFRIKDTLKAISDGLLGTFIALFRLAGGILFAFAFLYLIVDGFAGVLLGFVYYGVVSIMNSTFLIILKNKMFLRPKR